MAKKLVAKTDEYQKDGQTKGRYTTIGVFLSNQNGEYLLLDPTVSLSGILAKQNTLGMSSGGPMRDNVMCGIFEDQPQQGGYQNQPSPQAQQSSGAAPQSPPAADDFDDDQDIPF